MRILEGSAARSALGKLIEQRSRGATRVEAAVRRIVRDVKVEGDVALRRYSKRFDNLPSNQPLRVSVNELRRAWKEVPKSFRDALRFAAKNIRQFAEWQKPNEWQREIVAGAMVGQIVRPLESVGCYVPAGRHSLPSTLLMTAIPAQVAGVGRIVVVSPRPTSETLAAAAMLGVKEFYGVGGAHAIAALAYGAKTVRPVDKIVGPGSTYVTAAKKLVSIDCSIDMLAGPTETLIYSECGNAAFIAADLVAQAEHDVAASALFVTTRRRLAEEVAREVEKQVDGNATAQRALKRNGLIFLARSRHEAFELLNAIAPEHVTVDDADDVDLIRNAGSIFVGNYSAQPIGDYCSGPSHVLPTAGSARWRGGLSVFDFVKVITVQKLSRKGVNSVANCAIALAEAEGLRGHAAAVRLRLGEKAYA